MPITPLFNSVRSGLLYTCGYLFYPPTFYTPMRNTVSRMPFVDAMKAFACLLIVSHHLAFYGPMSDAAYPLMPGLIDWLYANGRIAVQVFFVISGFLLAAKFAPAGTAIVSDPVRDIKRRYMRLAVPYFAALALCIAAAAVARTWMEHDSIPAAPELLQLLSHVLLLQGLLGQDSLSAGVWYVAIDFQLFACAVFLLWGATRLESRFPALTMAGPVLIALLTVASLFLFNRDDRWSETAFYFFGAFGLGALSFWAAMRPRGMEWLALLGSLVLIALLLDFRSRIAVAGVVMLLLGVGQRYGVLVRLPMPEWTTNLGRISYSVFLVHFPICLIINMVFFQVFPQYPLMNAFGMMLALVLSVMTGKVFFNWIEDRSFASKMHIMLPAGFAASALLVALGSR